MRAEIHLEEDLKMTQGKARGNPETVALAQAIAARIESDAATLSSQWQVPQGTPTRHFIVDDLLDTTTARRIQQAFPENAAIWNQRSSFRERKKTFAKVDTIDPLIAAITDAFHRDVVLQSVARVTGLSGLEADPELYAGGI